MLIVLRVQRPGIMPDGSNRDEHLSPRIALASKGDLLRLGHKWQKWDFTGMIHGPRLIVCDEPTSALDSETGRRVMELMRELAVKTGRAVIVVTHDARIFEFADRVACMNLPVYPGQQMDVYIDAPPHPTDAVQSNASVLR